MEIIDTQDLEVVEETTANENEKEEKLFSQDEVNNIVQKRIDREMKKYKTDLVEAEKLARMSESEKAKHEFEQERQAFLTQKAEFDKAQLEVQAIKELSNKSLPTSFVNFILAEDAETINKNIESLQAEWSNAIQAEVNERLKGRTPQAGIGSQYANMSYEEFGKLPTKERAKLVDIDPDLLNKIKK